MVFAPPPMSPSQEPGVSSGAAGHASGSGGSGGSGGGGFGEKLYRWGTKAGVPVNRLVNKLGSEAFWPMTMDKECDKAARILRGFCQTGFYTTTTNTGNNNSSSNVNNPAHQRASSPSPPTKTSTTNTPSHSKVLAKIPKSVLASAKGLAIFTTFRTGLHLSGAGGSGVVVARLADGVSWSPPAGFLVHTLGAGLMVGIDVYDCVCVLTTQAAVDAFARRARLSLGGEIAVVAGPVGVGGAVEGFLPGKKGGAANPGGNANANVANTAGGGVAGGDGGVAGVGNEKDKDKNKTGNGPVWSYMKSRGFYAGVQADGTVIIPREEANAAFYGEHGISVERILKGQVKTTQQTPAAAAIGKEKAKDADLVMWPEGGRQLMETLKAVEGKRADEDVLRKLGDGPTPGDLAPPPDGGKV
ncbi:DUF500-domain-containing protein [Nemania sp. FL0916]|nr:DUF500-domain-containing protein [Nemania sp. FL0916]